MENDNAQNAMSPVFRSFLYVALPTLATYLAGAYVMGQFFCPLLFDAHGFSICVQEVGWRLFFWPVFLVLLPLYNPITLVVMIAVLVLALWRLARPRRKPLDKKT